MMTEKTLIELIGPLESEAKRRLITEFQHMREVIEVLRNGR